MLPRGPHPAPAPHQRHSKKSSSFSLPLGSASLVKESFDVAIVGSGFAGSLLALVARRIGLSVVLLEKGSHPRFAIGESTSPLANLLLEELAARYDLPRLAPFAEWGSWRRAYPEVSCGLKRGFSIPTRRTAPG